MFTTDELKQWITKREIDQDSFQKRIRQNTPDLDSAFEEVAKVDPKWALLHYYKNIRQLKMLAANGSEKEIDESWIPSQQSRHVDQYLDRIMVGWEKGNREIFDKWVSEVENRHQVKLGTGVMD